MTCSSALAITFAALLGCGHAVAPKEAMASVGAGAEPSPAAPPARSEQPAPRPANGRAATEEQPAIENEGAVTRYEDEATLGNADVTLVKSTMVHTAAEDGREVTLLLGGTSVTEVAEHDGSILVMFADPRNPANLEMGWISSAALERKPRGPCPRGQASYLNALGAFCATPCRDSRNCGANDACVPGGLAAVHRGTITNLLTYCVPK